MASLGATPRCDDPIRTALAQRIVVLAQAGERDPERRARAPCRWAVLQSIGIARRPAGAVAETVALPQGVAHRPLAIPQPRPGAACRHSFRL